MRIIDKIRLLAEYSPLLAIAQDILAEQDPYKRTLIAFQAIDWVADRTETDIDDNIVHHIKAVLGSEEGREAFNAAVEGVRELIENLTGGDE